MLLGIVLLPLPLLVLSAVVGVFLSVLHWVREMGGGREGGREGEREKERESVRERV